MRGDCCKMEADSTTYDGSSKTNIDEPTLPFPTCPGNYKLYKELSCKDGEKSLEILVVEKLQAFGLLPKTVRCGSEKPECNVVSRPARVVDKIQWVCEGCGKRQPIRTGSFFLRLQCSILQALQLILAWCEDADCDVAAEYFGIKPRVASMIYERLDELAVKEQSSHKLGGENSVVVAEMYPDCLTRLSPDTTDTPHAHRILMVADTNHIPTSYHLHVIKDDLKKHSSASLNGQSFITEIEEVISKVTEPDSFIVTGNNLPVIEGAATIQQLVQHCDADMQHFLTTRIWRQAITLCAASRDFCSPAPPAPAPPPAACALVAQKYLHTALYRLRYHNDFYRHVLGVLAEQYAKRFDVSSEV